MKLSDQKRGHFALESRCLFFRGKQQDIYSHVLFVQPFSDFYANNNMRELPKMNPNISGCWNFHIKMLLLPWSVKISAAFSRARPDTGGWSEASEKSNIKVYSLCHHDHTWPRSHPSASTWHKPVGLLCAHAFSASEKIFLRPCETGQNATCAVCSTPSPQAVLQDGFLLIYLMNEVILLNSLRTMRFIYWCLQTPPVFIHKKVRNNRLGSILNGGI